MLRFCVALSLFVFTSLPTLAAGDVILQPVLKNVESLPPTDLETIVQDLNDLRNKYGSRSLDDLAEHVRYAFQKHGYFKVLVENPVMPTASEVDHKAVVPVNVVVDAGEKYRLRDIGFTRSTIFSPGELRPSFPISDGDVFDREKIAVGLESLRKLYGARGHVTFSAVPETEIDESAKTVALNVHLDEGLVYYAGALTVRGEESQPGAREKLLNTWKAYEGRVYDLQTLDRFLHHLHARSGVRPDQVFETSFDPRTAKVNVYIYLARPIF